MTHFVHLILDLTHCMLAAGASQLSTHHPPCTRLQLSSLKCFISVLIHFFKYLESLPFYAYTKQNQFKVCVYVCVPLCVCVTMCVTLLLLILILQLGESKFFQHSLAHLNTTSCFLFLFVVYLKMMVLHTERFQ